MCGGRQNDDGSHLSCKFQNAISDTPGCQGPLQEKPRPVFAHRTYLTSTQSPKPKKIGVKSERVVLRLSEPGHTRIFSPSIMI
ncbi:hypothetical protein CMV_019376 [Castanea mollissima]|uniref:Uncharacterized protein n=1 Tax=Castanea mollissima TaxID=60419 RepID=A0A8J4R0H6_9ROSI|nr:hypothetical protein CMV_019376 [Castanea mollissima]